MIEVMTLSGHLSNIDEIIIPDVSFLFNKTTYKSSFSIKLLLLSAHV